MRLAIWLNSLLLVGALNAQDALKSGPPTVRAQGEATVSAKPDQVRADIGVVTQAQTAEAAAGQNAKQTSEVIAALKKSLPADSEIQTSGYSIHPNYRQTRDGSAPTITGYTATNTVQVKSSDIAGAGKLIDAATRAGANNVHGIQFTLKNENTVRAEALRNAVQNARTNAAALAAGAGMKVSRIVSIAEGEPARVFPVRAEMMRAQADTAAFATPMEPGEVQVRAVVTVTAELTQ
jgi:uncharacterized protein